MSSYPLLLRLVTQPQSLIAHLLTRNLRLRGDEKEEALCFMNALSPWRHIQYNRQRAFMHLTLASVLYEKMTGS